MDCKAGISYLKDSGLQLCILMGDLSDGSFGDWNVFVDGVCMPYCRMKFIHFLLTLVHFHADIYKQTHKTHKIARHPYKYFLRLFERNRIQIHLC